MTNEAERPEFMSCRDDQNWGENPAYLYTYAAHEDERELCRMELCALFGQPPEEGWLLSPRELDPGRSPFLKLRVDVRFEAPGLLELLARLPGLELGGATFKVVHVEAGSGTDYAGARQLEREAGARIRGRAEMRTPDRVFGLAQAGGRWVFGELRRSGAPYLRHVQKPQNYSTALSTRTARALVNIAAPQGAGVRLIDPCCGMGTVLIEALSMGIDASGWDMNPLAVRGARVNLRHFGYAEAADALRLQDMTTAEGVYDAAVLDMPYGLCSQLGVEEQAAMLERLHRLAPRAVVVTTGEIEGPLREAGLHIQDRAVLRKGSFTRRIYRCG